MKTVIGPCAGSRWAACSTASRRRAREPGRSWCGCREPAGGASAWNGPCVITCFIRLRIRFAGTGAAGQGRLLPWASPFVIARGNLLLLFAEHVECLANVSQEELAHGF